VKRTLIPALLGVLAAGCGDDSVGPGTSNNRMSATIDGQDWEADPSTVTVANYYWFWRQGTLSISGRGISNDRSITLLLSFIHGPGTYPLGVGYESRGGGPGYVSEPPNSWRTPYNGEAGTVTITTRTDTRIAGSFEFDATQLPGTAPSTTLVRNGEFDITVSGGLPDLPTELSSTFSATLDGYPWNAAIMSATTADFAEFDLGGGTMESFFIRIFPKVHVEVGQTYGIPGQIDFQISRRCESSGACIWRSEGGPDTGSVTITEFTDERLVGTFQGSIPPRLGGIEPMVVEDGQFNVLLELREIN